MSNNIARHRTAIRRRELSRPLQTAVRDGVISPDVSVFDFGCGQGDDLRHLETLGVPCFGWDPVFRKDGHRTEADVVNLGYVVNVIENAEERSDVLRAAWGFTRKALVVSARLVEEFSPAACAEYEDGYLTRLGTFQKFYDQQELRNWIEGVLGETSVAAAPGVFYIFRDQQQRESFVISRYRRKLAAPRQRLTDALFEKHRAVLDTLIEFVTSHGRLPVPEEMSTGAELQALFGSIRRAFAIIRRVTGTEQWDEITQSRSQDLLVYLALGRFPRRLPFGVLPADLQRDVKAFFGSYRRACTEADSLLFSAGEMSRIDRACQATPFGKLMPNALYVHVCGLDGLPPILRVFEGCARVLSGTVEGTTVLKLHRNEPKVSYLCYPDFDDTAHPALSTSLRVHLQTLRIKYRDFRESDNPPILHRKEEFIPRGHPQREAFAELTSEEEACGLFADPTRIGNRKCWEELLKRSGVRLEGHRLIKEVYVPPL